MEKYEALVNHIDREIQKHSDRRTDASPIPTCSATSLTLLTFSLRGERKKGATAGAMARTRDKRDCRRSATVLI
jgi:hypothetical protein